MAESGEDFGAGLTAAGVDYPRTAEWATTAQDMLWRRSKPGLHIAKEALARQEAYMGTDSGARWGVSAV